jgi:hypothetical protein
MEAGMNKFPTNIIELQQFRIKNAQQQRWQSERIQTPTDSKKTPYVPGKPPKNGSAYILTAQFKKFTDEEIELIRNAWRKRKRRYLSTAEVREILHPYRQFRSDNSVYRRLKYAVHIGKIEQIRGLMIPLADRQKQKIDNKTVYYYFRN